jgi:methylphosphotriester-DNA--protein-cysteine methyltransferase
MATAQFKSPKRKLVDFFQRSRDGWKRKYQESKRANKKLSNQARATERSRAHWREIAKEAQRRSQELERELEELKTTAW